MPSQHKHPPLSFRLPEAERAWLYKHKAATGLSLGAILTDAVRAYRAGQERSTTIPPRTTTTKRRTTTAEGDCKHPGVGHKHRCPKCGGYNV